MGTSPRSMRALGIMACLLVTIALAAFAPGASAAPRPSGATVTVLLAAPHPTRLERLASRHHLTARQRSVRLARLVPSVATRSRVERRLRARGFQILHSSTWAITASAPPAVASKAVQSDAGSLGAGVAAVAPVHEGLLRPMIATTGEDYRNAYASPGVTPSTGRTSSDTTIATIQFAQFDDDDLTRYATDHALSDPVASGQYTGVVIDGGPTDADGAVEVALDQQSILATAPSARQRAYFAPNSLSGYVDALAAVARDAESHHITALSISWGNCEAAWNASPRAVSVLETALSSVNAAGVTVFNSSGDNGIYGCRTSTGAVSSTASVSYPASSPYVVGVGGTSLSATTRTANNGLNWVETAWSCTSLDSCARSGGSGGGASALFTRQSWATTNLSGAYAASTRRLVPDIAAVADPSTGFDLTQCGSTNRYGGTSLSAPVVAALFTNALTDAGWNRGVGDIHDALYSAYSGAASTVFRDVTAGSNGATADRGANPSTSAGTGYDTVTGLGAVLWPALVARLGTPRTSPTVLPTTTANTTTWNLCGASGTTAPGTSSTPVAADAPGPTTRIALTSGRARHGRSVVVARWTTVRRSSVALSRTRVVVQDLTTGRVLLSGVGEAGNRTFRVRSGHLVRLTVTATDANGHGTRSTTTRRARR